MTMNHRINALALLILCSSQPLLAGEEALGRLFFTPQQRAVLDRQRLYNPNPQMGLERESSYTINGEVRRSSGPGVRWINGEAETSSPSEPPVAVGDTYHPTTGEKQDLLRGGQILIRRQSKPVPP